MKYIVKIPSTLNIVYCKKNRFVFLFGLLNKKSLKVDLQLSFNHRKRNIKVSSFPFYTVSKNKYKWIKSIQGSTVAMLKQNIMESSLVFYQKLWIVGVGYKILNNENLKNEVFSFKLGYSHNVHFWVFVESKIFCLKLTHFFIFANSYTKTTRLASIIRSLKKPEPYKGKGILYDKENIILKEGKKI